MNASSCSSGVRSFKADHDPSFRPPRRPRCPGNEARGPPGDATSEAAEMVAPVQSPTRKLGQGLGAERALSESHVHRVVEPLHPDDHRRAAPSARPSFRQPMEARPQRPSETIRSDIRTLRMSPEWPNRPASRAFDATWFSRNVNETPSSLIREPGDAHDPWLYGLRNPLPVRRRVASVKKKERPPKDARPKEKRFRHGGRKGRRATRQREDSKSR